MPDTTAAVCLLPEFGTGVVVLQNSLGLCDVADWTCQLILDTIFTGSLPVITLAWLQRAQ